MWIPKWKRDRKKGVDSPIPTQVVSNEEFIPRPQNEKQKQVEVLIGELAEEKSRKLGMERRVFMASSMGMATAFLASNMVYGNLLGRRRGRDAGAGRPRGEMAQGRVLHLRRADALHRRPGHRLPQHGVRPQHGLQAQERRGSLQLPQFRQGDVLRQRDEHGRHLRRAGQGDQQRREDGKVLEGKARTPGAAVADSAELADVATQERDQRPGRLPAGPLPGQLCPQPLLGPEGQTSPTFPRCSSRWSARSKLYGIDSWKWYCHTDPGRSGNGFKLDDEKMTYPFYEKSRRAGSEDFQRAQGLRVAVADARPPGQSRRRRKGRPGQSRPDLHHLSLRRSSTVRTSRTSTRAFRPDDRRLRLARRPDEDQRTQSQDDQRLSRRSARPSAPRPSSIPKCACT